MVERLSTKQAIKWMAFIALIALVVLVIFVAIGLTNNTLSQTKSITSVVGTGDVVVIHADNTFTIYNAVSPTNANNGIALLSAVANEVNGDRIFLRKENYSIGNNCLDLANGWTISVSIFGAGKSNTIISGGSTCLISPGLKNAVVADLSLTTNGNIVIAIQVYNPTANVTNLTIRNVKINVKQDGLYFQQIDFNNTLGGFAIPAFPSIQANVYNVTVFSNRDTIYSGANDVIKVFDSSFNALAVSSYNSQNYAQILYSQGGIIYMVNDIMVASNGITNTAGLMTDDSSFPLFGANVIDYMYGGNIIVSAGSGSVFAMEAGGDGLIYYNSSASFNTLSFTGNPPIALGNVIFGPYSYQRSPVSPPATLTVTTSTNYFTGQGNILLGVFEVVFIAAMLEIVLRMFGGSFSQIIIR